MGFIYYLISLLEYMFEIFHNKQLKRKKKRIRAETDAILGTVQAVLFSLEYKIPYFTDSKMSTFLHFTISEIRIYLITDSVLDFWNTVLKILGREGSKEWGWS